ncbi:hypothetical protein [Fusobacterium ulcerans]|uniref:hypothetical protein n=1 Tax=Fusobacterium ulcerans TaxID=861 RepID=UPI002E75ED05|nr:hypothetical protein [Fusobacterium ulcerans]MEE0138998.1 hypothetical protein [Fusobacterium ulcerans]
MTLQEKFNQARKNMQEQFSSYLSFEVTEENSYTMRTEIFLGNTIISVGFYSDSQCTMNDVSLGSMLEAIANYDLNLIPKE